MKYPGTESLDCYQLELYERRAWELSIFGTLTPEEAHAGGAPSRSGFRLGPTGGTSPPDEDGTLTEMRVVGTLPRFPSIRMVERCPAYFHAPLFDRPLEVLAHALDDHPLCRARSSTVTPSACCAGARRGFQLGQPLPSLAAAYRFWHEAAAATRPAARASRG
jgi:hypothetical protein